MKRNIYPTRIYKTMRGYLNACNRSRGYVEANKFFDSSEGSGPLCSSRHGDDIKFWYAQPSPELRAMKAKEFEKSHWRRSDPARLEALTSGRWADFSYLQCFYISGGKWHGNSLSGDAYNYCRRKFTQSAK